MFSLSICRRGEIGIIRGRDKESKKSQTPRQVYFRIKEKMPEQNRQNKCPASACGGMFGETLDIDIGGPLALFLVAA